MNDKLREIADRHAAFLYWYNLNGGIKGQEVDDIGVLLAELAEYRKELELTAEELDESPTVYELIGIRHRILELLK